MPGMTGAQYQLLVQAKIKEGTLEKDLEATKAHLEARGLNVINIQPVFDKQGNITKYSAKYEDEMGRISTETVQFGKIQEEVAGKIQTTGTEITRTTRRLEDTKKMTKAAAGETENLGKKTNWLTDSLGQAVMTAAKYALGLGLIYKAMAQISEGVQFIKDLDKEMRNIQIVAGYTNEEIQDLSISYNDLAKQMGATTLEVASGSLEWIRQGKTIEETNELLQSTLMLSKLGNVETAEATQYLTSILNGFKLEASDTEEVVSKLVAVDNAAATSVKELATALQAGSVSAQKAGVDFDELVAYIGTVSSVTRQNAARIGTAFRTMFARFQDIKTGAIDDTGMALNNVEAALNRVTLATGENMSIVNRQTGQFRDFSDVLTDLYTVWDDLTDVEQANIAKALAGVRQREVFLTLMENEEMMLGLLKEAHDSSGLAADRYAIYLEGVESAQNKARASWEEMWQTTIDSDMITVFYEAAAGASEFITELGGLDDALLAIIGTIGVLATVTGKLPALLAVNPWIAIAVAIGGATMAVANFVGEIERYEKEAGGAVGELVRGLEEESESFEEVVDGYIDAIGRIKQAYEDAPFWAKPFIDQQDILDNSLTEMLPLIAKNAESWEEYYVALKEVAQASGYSVDESGRLYREVEHGGVVVREYSDGFKLLERSMFSVNEELDDHIRKQEILSGQFDNNISRMAEFTEVFGALLYMMSEESGEDRGIEKLVNDFSNLNRMLREGTLAPGEYFEQMESNLDALDFTEVFAGNDEAASLFFTGLVENSAESIGFINEQWEAGELSFTQYTDSLAELGDVFVKIGGISETFLGTDNAVSQAISNITDGINSLRQAQEMNVIVQDTMRQVTEESLQFGAEAYNEQMERVAHAMEASGVMYTTTSGDALKSADDIYGYLTETSGNFQILAGQSANATGSMIEDVVSSAGSMIVRLADMIDSFNARINFTPVVDMSSINLLGMNLPWPSRMSIEVGADISVSRPTIGSGWGGLSAYGNEQQKSLTDMLRHVGKGLEEHKLDLSAGDYGEGILGGPKTYKTASDEAKKYADTVGSLTHSYNEAKQAAIDAEKEREKASKAGAAAAKKAASEAEKALKAQQNAQKDALKEQLKGYKHLIDVRKQLLDSMEDELDYQRKLSAKQSDLSRIQAEIEEIRLDDSEEAAARRRALEEEASEIALDIAETQADRRIDIQKEALDAEYEAYKRHIESKIAKIDAIGSGTTVPIPSYHTGGIVGGATNNTEVVAKLLSGELVSTQSQMDNFIRNILPSMLGTSVEMAGVGSGMNVENLMPITVSGNLDSTVLPEISKIADRVVEKLNQNMQKRGLTRNANAFLT